MFKESEVCTKDGAWYLMRIMPYRTADNVIDGLVLTFVDIQRLKAGEQATSFLRVSSTRCANRWWCSTWNCGW